MSNNLKKELQRLCALASSPPAPLEQTVCLELIWLKGTPVPADNGSIGLRIATSVSAHVGVEDIENTKREKGTDIFSVAVRGDAEVVITTTTTQIIRAGAAGELEASDPLSALAEAAVHRQALPPWFRPAAYWDCLRSEAYSCQGLHGRRLYDDQGFLNGALLECYLESRQKCEVLARALPAFYG